MALLGIYTLVIWLARYFLKSVDTDAILRSSVVGCAALYVGVMVTGGVLGTVQNVADKTSGTSMAADMSNTGSMDIAGLATASMAGNMSATASMMNAGQLGAITAMTSSLIQNVIAARPASLTGLLR